jgi:hypothetical protein
MNKRIKEYFDCATKDKECVDNYRYADLRYPEEVKKYLETYYKGCCGYSDNVIYDNGNLFLVGFNYGH